MLGDFNLYERICRKLDLEKAHAAGAVSHERTAAATRQSLVQVVVTTWMAQ